MAGLKEIKRRIKSVKNTEKITYAMKLVSAAKLRKTQDSLLHAREYMSILDTVLGNITIKYPDVVLENSLMTVHKDVKRVRYIVVGGKRGLSGAYNSNVNKLLENAIKSVTQQSKCEVEIVPLGKQPAEYCKRKNYNYIATYENISEDVEDWPLDEVFANAAHDFISNKIDEVYILFTRFQSAMVVKPTIEKFLPFGNDFNCEKIDDKAGVMFKPSIKDVLKMLLPKYAQSRLFLACLESKTSEHGSRMTAMDAATHNAAELISSLTITHNKLRQASITNDMLDIIGGSASSEK